MGTLTINDLLKECQSQVKKGNGNKKIMISEDEEGNGYHDLFYGISECKDFDFCGAWLHDCSEDEAKENYVILG